MVVLHELGHLLGLGHKFDGTLSVMSYEFDAKSLSTYDIRSYTRPLSETKFAPLSAHL